MLTNPESHHEKLDKLAGQAKESIEQRIKDLEIKDNKKSEALLLMKSDIMSKIKAGKGYADDLRLDTKELTEVYKSLEINSKTLLSANGIRDVEGFFKLIGFNQLEFNIESGTTIEAKGHKRPMPLWETDKILKIDLNKTKKKNGQDYVYAEIKHDRGKFRPNIRGKNRYRTYKGYVLRSKLVKAAPANRAIVQPKPKTKQEPRSIAASQPIRRPRRATEAVSLDKNLLDKKVKTQALLAMDMMADGKFKNLGQVRKFIGFEGRNNEVNSANRRMYLQIIQYAAELGMPIDQDSFEYWRQNQTHAKAMLKYKWDGVNNLVSRLATGKDDTRKIPGGPPKGVSSKMPKDRKKKKTKSDPKSDPKLAPKPEPKPAPKPELDPNIATLRKKFAAERKENISPDGALTDKGVILLKTLNEPMTGTLAYRTRVHFRKKFGLPNDHSVKITKTQLIKALGGFDSTQVSKIKKSIDTVGGTRVDWSDAVANPDLTPVKPSNLYELGENSSKASLEKLIRKGNSIVIISNEYCKPCKELALLLPIVATMTGKKFNVIKIDRGIDKKRFKRQGALQRLGPKSMTDSVPKIFFMQNGKEKHFQDTGSPTSLINMVDIISKQFGLVMPPKYKAQALYAMAKVKPKSVFDFFDRIPKELREKCIRIAIANRGESNVITNLDSFITEPYAESVLIEASKVYGGTIFNSEHALNACLKSPYTLEMLKAAYSAMPRRFKIAYKVNKNILPNTIREEIEKFMK